jgi:hypothetical protein
MQTDAVMLLLPLLFLSNSSAVLQEQDLNPNATSDM